MREDFPALDLPTIAISGYGIPFFVTKVGNCDASVHDFINSAEENVRELWDTISS